MTAIARKSPVLPADIFPIYAWVQPRDAEDCEQHLKPKPPSKRLMRAADDGTLTDRAYRELEEMIVTLQLSPGTILSEQALALRLKIGRAPLRGALPRL